MISLTSFPQRIKNGETVKIKLDIQGQLNLKMYKGTYFNLILKKNGGTNGLGNTTLYPLRFNGNSLEWDININSYETFGTFNVGCVIQNSNQMAITSTTFIVEPDCANEKINKNITLIEQIKKFKNTQIKKEEIPINHTGRYLIQKPSDNLPYEFNQTKFNQTEFNQTKSNQNFFTGKIQKAIKNVK